jgi:16S rRNA (guanine(966)-N(2))-methyltransferase RsmD
VRLEVPRQIRPTEERVRQAFFNILGDRIEGVRLIDGCAGSGAVGIDALSRGASFVVFIESHPACVRALQANLARIDPAAVDGGWTIVRGDILRVLRAHGQKPWADGGIDLLWLDPPYADGLGRKLLQRLGDCAILAPSGIVCVEHARREELPPASGLLRRRSQHRYGHTVLSFYERQTLLPHP